MNRGLLAFAILLIVAGAAIGFIPLIIIGIFLLFPALLAGSRRKVPPKPTATRYGGAVAAPRPPPPTLQVSVPQPAPAPMPVPTTAPASTESRSTVSQPLFPAQMFLTLNPVQYPKVEPTKEPPKGEDMTELIGLLAAMGLIRLLSRRTNQGT